MFLIAAFAYNQTRSQAVVNIAKQQLGKPYVWGATGPDSFDCSGLAQYSYKKGASYSLPRVANDQFKTGTSISKSSKQMGDLIFFNWDGNTSPANHVGIMVNGSHMIHASNPSKPIGYQDVTSNYYNTRTIGVRRYF